jgi:hypothetical protein
MTNKTERAKANFDTLVQESLACLLINCLKVVTIFQRIKTTENLESSTSINSLLT